MANLSKGVKNLTNVAKAAGVSTLAFAQAHPVALAFTVIAVVGLGITIYYVKHSNKMRNEGNLEYSRDGSIPHPENGINYFYDPATKSITDFSSSKADSSDCMFRNKVSQNGPSTSKINYCEKSSVTISKEVYTEASGNSQNNCDYLDMSEENNINKDSRRSISEIDLRESNDKPSKCYSSYESHSMDNVDENSSNVSDLILENSSKVSPEVSDVEKSILTVSKEVHTETFGKNQNFYDDHLDMSEKENINEDVLRGTFENYSKGSSDKPAQCCSSYGSHSADSSDVNSSNVTDLISLNCSKVSSEASDKKSKLINSKEVCTKTFVNNQTVHDDHCDIDIYEEDNVSNTIETNSTRSCNNHSQFYNISRRRSVNNLDENFSNISEFNASTEEVTGIRSVTSVGTLLSEESDWCRACEENLANTRMQPCNHRYMCGSCAVKIVRLFKRCKFCGARINEISLEVS